MSWSTCAFWVKRDPLPCQNNRCLDLYLASSSPAFYLHILVLMAWPARVPQGKWEYSSGCLQSGSSYDGTTLLRPSHSFCFQSLSSHLHVSFQSLLQKCFLMPGKLKWGSTPIYGELGEIHQEISAKKRKCLPSFPLSLHFKTAWFFSLQVFTRHHLSDYEQQKPQSADIDAGLTLWAAQMISHCIFFFLNSVRRCKRSTTKDLCC